MPYDEITVVEVDTESRIHPLMMLEGSSAAMNTMMEKDGEDTDPSSHPVLIITGTGFNLERQEAVIFVPDSKKAAELSEVILFMLLDEEGVERVMDAIDTEAVRMREKKAMPHVFQNYSGDQIEMWPEGEEEDE